MRPCGSRVHRAESRADQLPALLANVRLDVQAHLGKQLEVEELADLCGMGAQQLLHMRDHLITGARHKL